MNRDFTTQKYGLKIRLVNESDAEFIVSLRTNPLLKRYISNTDASVERQKNWIREYYQRESENLDFYFVFTDENDKRLGVCRIYNIHDSYFTTGSWIFSPDAGPTDAARGDLFIKDFGYDFFPGKSLRFEVHKKNKLCLGFQRLFKPNLIDSDDIQCFYELPKEIYLSNVVNVKTMFKIEDK